MPVTAGESREASLRSKIPQEILSADVWKGYVFPGSGTTAVLPPGTLHNTSGDKAIVTFAGHC